MRSPRLAELVADKIRSEILSGSIVDGGRLDAQEVLLGRFEVGLPSVREALRILEVEGLVTVHRGKVGGSTVRVPNADQVAYMMAMVLESRQVGLRDVAETLHRLEPICAGMCAALPRAERRALVQRLNRVNEEHAAALDGGKERFIELALEFHELLVTGCGNESMALAVGGLERVWTAHEPAPHSEYPESSVREQLVEVHRAIARSIEQGDENGATKLTTAHLRAAKSYHMSSESRPYVLCAQLRPTHSI